MAEERVDNIVCPKCANDGTHGVIRYVETIECYRKVLGVEGGQVRVEGRYQSGEGYDDGRDPYFECHGSEVPGGWCGHRWPVPPAVEQGIDWVADDPPPPKAPEAPPAPAEARAAAEPSLETLACPKCGVNVASGLVHWIEHIEADRQIVGVRDGQLRVSSLYDTDADDGGDQDPHFECHNRLSETRWCDERWPVPEWARRLVLWV